MSMDASKNIRAFLKTAKTKCMNFKGRKHQRQGGNLFLLKPTKIFDQFIKS